MKRKHFLAASAAIAGSAVATPALAQSVTLPFDNGERALAAFPQKRQLIVLSSRPVQLETPAHVFDAGEFTPNDEFFVRWHLPDVPTHIDPSAFRVNVHGAVATPVTLGLDDLRSNFEAVEVNAVLECAGNSRGFSSPRVPGGQWANGAMGNAKWRGARLRDVLVKAKVGTGAVQVRFQGAERPALPTTPQFLKSLDLAVAVNPNVILAYQMNGSDLPVLNGYPLRLIVPGYFGTYWVKALTDIEVLTEPDQNYWMKTAYRVPNTPNYSVAPSDTGFATVPLTNLTVRSFITNFTDGAAIGAGRKTIRGIAFDGGTGIRSVEISSDGGTTWRPTDLGPDLGKFSFRRWTATFDAQAGQRYVLASRAVSNAGEGQVQRWNPSGYARNAVDNLSVSVNS
jgi:DMSO/TMAO reductase YedYZ molybdopterin-dependent catalytic subunit